MGFGQKLFAFFLGKGHEPKVVTEADVRSHIDSRTGAATAVQGTTEPQKSVVKAHGLESGFMDFGLFIPQGWRLDLVDIPTENHWPVMHELATYADNSAWDSLWVYDHFCTLRKHDHQQLSPRHRRRSRVHLPRRQRVPDRPTHEGRGL